MQWFNSVVDDANGVDHIDLNLHAGPLNAGLQAQIAYQDTYHADVKYAYRNTDWFTETIADVGKLGDTVQLYFDTSNVPQVVFFNRELKVLYGSTRLDANDWSVRRLAASSGPMSVNLNERSDDAMLTYLNRPRSSALSVELV